MLCTYYIMIADTQYLIWSIIDIMSKTGLILSTYMKYIIHVSLKYSIYLFGIFVCEWDDDDVCTIYLTFWEQCTQKASEVNWIIVSCDRLHHASCKVCLDPTPHWFFVVSSEFKLRTLDFILVFTCLEFLYISKWKPLML